MSVPSGTLPVAVYHEHPDWFKPLFAELDRRGIPWVALDAAAHEYDPADLTRRYSLVVNRNSPSAYLRGHGQTTFHTLNWLRHVERTGTPIVNGSAVYALEISKAFQVEVLAELGLPVPRALVINHASRAASAARQLRYPVVVKANIGGSGAGIVRFDTEDQLVEAAAAGRIDLGLDQTALVQELAPLSGSRITRVEVLDGKFLYAINVYPTGESFNLCPADICQTTEGRTLDRTFCAADAPKTGMRVERADPPAEIVAQVEQIARHVRLDIGGIEYLIDERDGRHYFYDINALSNFVADAPNVIGFDPFARFVDYIEVRAGLVTPAST